MPATIISEVWECFDVFENKSFKCKVDDCGFHFNPPLRSTTAMGHLQRQHPDVRAIVFFMEEARKNGKKKVESSADENEPVAKKSRSEYISVEEAMPTSTHDLKTAQKTASPEKAASNAERKAHVLQSSSAENVQEVLPDAPSPAHDSKRKDKRKMVSQKVSHIGHDSQTERVSSPSKKVPNMATSARGSVAKQNIENSLQKAMPKEAPSTSKDAMLAKEYCMAVPPVVGQTDGSASRVKRQAAIEAEKRIGHLNDWLNRVRKEQKEVRAKRTAIRRDTNVEEEDADIDWPVDLCWTSAGSQASASFFCVGLVTTPTPIAGNQWSIWVEQQSFWLLSTGQWTTASMRT